MAKHSSLVRAHAPIVVLPRARGKFRRGISRVASGGRHVARRFGSASVKAMPTVGVALGALIGGYADGKGYLAKLPAIGGSRAFTLGAIGFAATRFVRNPHVRAAGLAALAVAAYDFGKQQAGGVSGLDSTEGDGGSGDF